jgi:hypothetical protein
MLRCINRSLKERRTFALPLFKDISHHESNYFLKKLMILNGSSIKQIEEALDELYREVVNTFTLKYIEDMVTLGYEKVLIELLYRCNDSISAVSTSLRIISIIVSNSVILKKSKCSKGQREEFNLARLLSAVTSNMFPLTSSNIKAACIIASKLISLNLRYIEKTFGRDDYRNLVYILWHCNNVDDLLDMKAIIKLLLKAHRKHMDLGDPGSDFIPRFIVDYFDRSSNKVIKRFIIDGFQRALFKYYKNKDDQKVCENISIIDRILNIIVISIGVEDKPMQILSLMCVRELLCRCPELVSEFIKRGLIHYIRLLTTDYMQIMYYSRYIQTPVDSIRISKINNAKQLIEICEISGNFVNSELSIEGYV